MVLIRYPQPDFKIKKEHGREVIFDSFRKKWVPLTPEEWVRQNFINYLVTEKKYPPSLIAVEKEISLGELRKRFDVLVYDANHQPRMMVECKAMNVPLGENVLQQLLRYNISVPVEYLVITNGEHCHAWKKNGAAILEINELPLPDK